METFRAGAKWVFGILWWDRGGYGIFVKRAAMEAIGGGDQQLALFQVVQVFVYLEITIIKNNGVLVELGGEG